MLRRLLAPRLAPRARVEPDYVNEAINDDLQGIFIAIPKTGTTSVREQIRPKGEPLVPQPHLDIRQVRDLIYLGELRSSLSRCTRFPTQDVDDDDAVRRRAREKFDGFFKFSAVRNPWARAVSLYFRREGVRTAGTTDFEQFVRDHRYASDTCQHPTLHRCQMDWITDESGRIAVDYTYRLEDFDVAVREIEERSDGRIRLAAARGNENPGSRSGQYRDMYSDASRRLIATRFERDIDAFGYTF